MDRIYQYVWTEYTSMYGQNIPVCMDKEIIAEFKDL